MKISVVCAMILAGAFISITPQPVRAQYVYGLSSVGYNQNSREIFGQSATWVDYEAGYYYDPEVLGELYWQFNNEVPLDSGYAIGLSIPQYGILIPAIAYTDSRSYLPLTTYTTYSTHFVRSYYYYSYCSGFTNGCYADPFGFTNYFGGFFGGDYGWPGFGFDPYYRVSGRRYTLGTTQVSITTPLDNPCGSSSSGQNSAESTNAPCPTPTPTPAPASIILSVEPAIVRPASTTGGQNTANVVVRTVPATANLNVTLSLEGVQNEL